MFTPAPPLNLGSLRALITLFLLSTIALGVYIVAVVLAPALPEQAARLAREDTPLIETPPTVMLATDTPTAPPATATRAVPRIVTAAPETAEPTSDAGGAALCRNRDMQIVSPVDGATVTAGADIVVTVRLEPGSGRRFWLELGAAAGGGPFRALGPAHAEPVERAALERVPDGLPAGRHVLRLVLAEPSGRIEPENVCDVRVLVR